MGPDHISASDGFAIAMLAMIFLSMAVVGMLVFCMRRNASRRDPHVDALLEELEEDARRESLARANPEAGKPVEPWAREGDWWKQ